MTDLFSEAQRLVTGPRRHAYGRPAVNHARTAALWNAYLDHRGVVPAGECPPLLTAEDVCWLNILQKIAREMHGPSPDSLVDVAGYLLNIEEIRGG